MTDLTTLLPLATETPETIKARLLADVNAGVDPTDPSYLDTVPGSFWDDLTGAVSLEFDRIYDRMHSEVPAAALPTTSAGEWLDAWADAVGLERKDETAAAGVVEFTAPEGMEVPIGTQVSTVQTSPDAEPIVLQTTAGGVVGPAGLSGLGVVALPVRALAAGAVGNVAANTVTILESNLDEDTTITNPNAITGGSDVETDQALAQRVGRKMGGAAGAGNVDWYIDHALSEPGVGFVTVFPNTPSVGHVTLRITDINNDPAPGDLIDRLQARLDPSDQPAQGAGEAAPGATVHVGTATATAITVAAAVVSEPGYSIDGADGTRATGLAIAAAVARYINGLPAGGDVIHSKTLAAIVDVEGVADLDAADLLLNGSAANVAIDDAHVSALSGTPTITEA